MSDDNDDSGKYRVGYKKPPVKTRFQPGQSGNPSGRPKMRPRLSDRVATVLDEITVFVEENGRNKLITQSEAAVRKLVERAMAGDIRAFKIVHELESESNDGACRQYILQITEDEAKL